MVKNYVLKYLVTYKKPNNETIQHLVSYTYYHNYKIGQINGFGWTIIDLQVFYNGKFIKERDFKRIINDKNNLRRKINLFRKLGLKNGK